MSWINIVIDLFINGGLIGGLGWYVKHKIETNSKIQINSIHESDKAARGRMLEELKADISWESEIRKIRFSSIYERRINALLDVYDAVYKYELAIDGISLNVIHRGGESFEKFYEIYCAKRQTLSETFWCNAALFEESIINSFKHYREMIYNYDMAYERILREPAPKRSYSALPKLAYEQSQFSSDLKQEVKDALANS